jgi:hypothetical protein
MNIMVLLIVHGQLPPKKALRSCYNEYKMITKKCQNDIYLKAILITSNMEKSYKTKLTILIVY